MNIFKHIALAAMLASPCAAFCGEDNYVLTFGTTGPDCYADGTQVADGECYALVWTKRGGTLDITVDGAAANDTCKVLGIFACAENHACPERFVQVSSGFFKANGEGAFSLVLLDTRKGDGTVSAKDGAFDKEAGRVNGYVAVSSASSQFSIAKVSSQATVSTPTAVPAEIENPVITGYEIRDGKAYITVSGTSRKLDYGVAVGDTAAAARQNEASAGVKAGKDGEAIELTVELPADKPVGFFKVGRAPLK